RAWSPPRRLARRYLVVVRYFRPFAAHAQYQRHARPVGAQPARDVGAGGRRSRRPVTPPWRPKPSPPAPTSRCPCASRRRTRRASSTPPPLPASPTPLSPRGGRSPPLGPPCAH